jgi:mannose-6-phosphate isomerase-like protein (cupin superfamily)
MAIQRLGPGDFGLLENPGVRSEQILWPRNAPEAKLTITRVTMLPGAVQARHVHPASEQTWMVEQGTATLLLAYDQTEEMRSGDVLRTPLGEVHGIINTGSGPFVYLAVTVPPQNFMAAYGRGN